MSSLNPYAAPQSTSDPSAPAPRSAGPTAGLIAVLLVFAVLRGVGAGFATLIFWVHCSGTSIHWHNVVPILTGILLGFAAMHSFEWWFATRKDTTLLIAMFGYLMGATVVTIAGFFQYFPTPF